jgi:hypothetical protein
MNYINRLQGQRNTNWNEHSEAAVVKSANAGSNMTKRLMKWSLLLLPVLAICLLSGCRMFTIGD